MNPDLEHGQSGPGSPPIAQRVGRIALALVLVLIGLWILHEFLAALVWAAIFAIALWPLYRRLVGALPTQSKRVLASLLLTALVALAFVVPFVYLAIALAHEMHLLVELLAEARRSGIPVPDWVPDLPGVGHTLADWWRTNLSDPTVSREMLGRMDTRSLAESAREYGGEVVHRLALFGFTLLTLFFLFRDGASFAGKLRRLSDRVIGVRGEQIALHMISAVHGTVNGLVLVGLAEGVVLGIVYFAAGLAHPVLIGALTGVLAVVPFGAPVIFCAAALILLAQGSAGAAAVVVGAGFVVVFIADHFIRPFLIGGAARLPFLWVLLGILGGLQSLGFLGLFVGPAVMAALISLWREWTEPEAAAVAAELPLAPPQHPPPDLAGRPQKV
ncbi:MAG: AI-2E family transporter [Alphaproteobacteria bacterium]|nr:AI-2E family transporter [Alphaproteobacteria bacterium]